MVKNFGYFESKVVSKHRYYPREHEKGVYPVFSSYWFIFIDKKGLNILIKQIDRQLKDPRITKGKYRYLSNLKKRYLKETEFIAEKMRQLEGDFDGDTLNMFDTQSHYIDTAQAILSTYNLCKHRFKNGKTALIGIDLCRCELCNREFHKDIIEDQEIINEDDVISKIKMLDIDDIMNKQDEE